MTHMMSGRELDEAALPLTGYCQYCGMAGAHVQFWRCEIELIDAGRVRGPRRVYYACGREHFEATVREETVAEMREQLDADIGGASEERSAADYSSGPPEQGVARVRSAPPVEWTVMDRYCWSCGTHGALFNSNTRCSGCGELQRLYLRERLAT